MADKPWKRTERSVAARLGGRRVPITGRQRGDVPDVQHEWLSIEVKHRRQLPDWIKDALTQAVAAKRGNQLPVAILHQQGTRHDNDLIVIRMADFIDWFGDPKGEKEQGE